VGIAGTVLGVVADATVDVGSGGTAVLVSAPAQVAVVAVPAMGAIRGVTNLLKNSNKENSGASPEKGGGKNEQKSNPDRVQSAKDKISDLKEQRDTLKSKPNKTPEDKANLDKLNRAINRETDRMKKSETHSRKQKGQQ
jgi:hypothetical protein